MIQNKEAMEEVLELSIPIRNQIKYLAEHSAYYARIFQKYQIDATTIHSLEDFQKLPFTSKEDLHAYNDDFLCVPKNQVIDIVTTSGTLGEPVAFYLTDGDLDRLAHNEYLALSTAGINSNDTVQITTTLDKMFMAGTAYYLGLRKIGASLIRVGPGVPEIQWQNIKRFKPTVLIAVPSFVLKMLEYAEKNGINYTESSIAKIICIGEPIRNEDFSYNTLGATILHKWPLKLYSTYASTEMATAFTECDEGCGGHINEDLIFVECLDDEGNTVPKGTVGELVITTLGVEGMPLLRFKTGDISFVVHRPCTCGKNSPRLGPILGRKQQMIKYKGTTLYPPAISEVLRSLKEVQSFITEVCIDEMGLDDLTVYVYSKEQNADTEKKIKDHFRATIRVAPTIVFKTLEEIEKWKLSISFRKPVDFIDKRLKDRQF